MDDMDGSLTAAENRLMGLDLEAMVQPAQDDETEPEPVEADDAESAEASAEAEDGAAEEEEDVEGAEEPDDTSDDISYEMPDLLEVRETDDGVQFGVEIDGELRTLQDLRDSYFRTSDYTRKTTELAEERRAVEAIRAESAQARQQYMDRLPLLEDAIKAVIPERDAKYWEDLKARDRDRYIEEREAYDFAKSQLDGLTQHREQLVAEARAEAARKRQELAVETDRRLREVIPAWSDESVMVTETGQLVDYLTTSYQVTPEERAMSLDWRTWDMAYKAMKYDEMMANGGRDLAASKTAKKSPTLKAGRPSTPKEVEAKKSRTLTAARKRLKQDGSVKSAQAVMEELLQRTR